MKITYAVFSDTHVNSIAGLCPPVFQRSDAGEHYPNKAQQWLWNEAWLPYWEAVKKAKSDYCLGVFVGDGPDGNKHTKAALISHNDNDIAQAALDTLEPARDIVDDWVILRGTEAHGGELGKFEERLAKELNAIQDKERHTYSWYWWTVKMEGIQLGFSHHPPSNSIRPYTRGGGANRSAVIWTYEYWGEDEYPQLITHAHVHHDEDSYDNHPIRVTFLPAFSVHDAYCARIGLIGQRITVGGNIYTVSDGALHIEKFRRTTKRREPWTKEQIAQQQPKQRKNFIRALLKK